MDSSVFVTILKATEDPKFHYILKDEIKRIHKRRRDILKGKSSHVRLKSDAFSTLERLGYMVDGQNLINEFLLISSSQSKLPCRERYWVEDFMRVVTSRLIMYYDDERQKFRKTKNGNNA